MNFDALRKLLGLGGQQQTQGPRGRNPGQPLSPLPARAMIQDGQPGGYSSGQNGLINGYRPEPGYEQQAQQYADAFKPTPGHPYGSSDTNPMVVGPNAIDPMHFGYPADNTAVPPSQQRQPQMPNFEDILKGLRIRF